MNKLIISTLMSMIISVNANADVLYNNLTDASEYADQVSSAGPLADSFSTGASKEALSDAILLLTNFGNAPTGSFTVSLYSDNATSPGVLLENLATYNDSVLSGIGTIDTSASGYVLAANTRYWIEVSTTNNSVAGWVYEFGNNPGSEYNYNNTGVSANSSIGPYQMEIIAQAVPEPSTLALMGLGLTGLAAQRRKSA